jgi:ubiquinone/menaquinone biosynthesis C-methylase UbiE
LSRQKDTFLSAEGDAWFRRNETALAAYDWSHDPVCRTIESLPRSNEPFRLLEIGCGDGARLQYLAGNEGFKVCGIEPSQLAVTKAQERGIQVTRATADALPFADSSMDIVVFGFCLYLCDDRDLFKIAHEADRVLASVGWLLILDFEARAPTYKAYHHREGILTRKMEYAPMFTWHPAYTVASYEKFHHGTRQWTDDPDEWVSMICLRKRCPPQ